MAFDLGNLLQQYIGGANNGKAADDFDQVAQNAPRASIAQGIAGALRSDQTPPFPQMVSQLFGQSNPDQRAGMLSKLLGGNGALLSSVAGGALAKIFGNNAPTQVTPEQASQISPEQVQELAEKAQQQNPGIVDRMGDFYAEHPTLIKAAGGAALAVALGYMAQHITKQSPQKEGPVGILSNIFHKIFPGKKTTHQRQPRPKRLQRQPLRRPSRKPYRKRHQPPHLLQPQLRPRCSKSTLSNCSTACSNRRASN